MNVAQRVKSINIKSMSMDVFTEVNAVEEDSDDLLDPRAGRTTNNIQVQLMKIADSETGRILVQFDDETQLELSNYNAKLILYKLEKLKSNDRFERVRHMQQGANQFKNHVKALFS